MSYKKSIQKKGAREHRDGGNKYGMYVNIYFGMCKWNVK